MTQPVVSIRPVEDDDLSILYAYQSDPVAAAMAVFPIRTLDAFLEHWATIRASATGTVRTVLADDVVVGNIMTWTHDGEREVGYWIGREHWGRGYATQALRLLLAEVADRPIMARIALDNLGSQRVVEHCGFVRVGEVVADDGVHEAIYRLD